jgi:hypothetical protein
VRIRDHVTSALDVLGLLGVAVGVGAGSAHWLGWFGAAVGGAILIGGSLLINRSGGDPR